MDMSDLETLLKKAKLSRGEKVKAKAWFNGTKPVDENNVVQLILDFLDNQKNPVLTAIPDTPYIDVKKAIKRYKLDSRIPNFGVYAVGSTVTGKGQYKDIDLVWADPRFGLISDFAQYVSNSKIPVIASQRFEITYIDSNSAEATAKSPLGARIHICIPGCYETLHWMGAVQKTPDFFTPRQYEKTKEFKEAKKVILFRSK
jgi:hypothetical protein